MLKAVSSNLDCRTQQTTLFLPRNSDRPSHQSLESQHSGGLFGSTISARLAIDQG